VERVGVERGCEHAVVTDRLQVCDRAGTAATPSSRAVLRRPFTDEPRRLEFVDVCLAAISNPDGSGWDGGVWAEGGVVPTGLNPCLP
jgi:hypothetical protein